MGYAFTNKLSVGCSDTASDFLYSIANSIIEQMKDQTKVEENAYNTDGILNVAMVIQDCFQKGWKYTAMGDYIKEFIPQFEKWIEQQSKQQWNDEHNKQKHLQAYQGVLKNIKKIKT